MIMNDNCEHKHSEKIFTITSSALLGMIMLTVKVSALSCIVDRMIVVQSSPHYDVLMIT